MTTIDHTHDTMREPTTGEVFKALGKRVALPGLISFIVIMAIGWIIKNPLNNLPVEEDIAKWFASQRTDTLNPITSFFSTMNDTWPTITCGIVYSIIVFALTRKWWLGILPGLAITLEATVFVIATNLIDRPRPLVPHLDPAPPTSSYPSGHTAASFALYWTIMLLARRIRNDALRTVIQVVCAILPFLVAYSRLYRGMHHLSDVIIGGIFGIWCAFTCYHYLPQVRAGERHAIARD